MRPSAKMEEELAKVAYEHTLQMVDSISELAEAKHAEKNAKIKVLAEDILRMITNLKVKILSAKND